MASQDNLPEKKTQVTTMHVKLPKALKNFFFTELKAGRQFKDCEKEIGIIQTVTIIITPEKTFMRASSATQDVDTPFTPDEKTKLLKTFRVPQKTVEECKSIFFMLDVKTQTAHIRQKKYDGSVKEITL